MYTRQRLAALTAAGVLLTAGVTASAPVSASAPAQAAAAQRQAPATALVVNARLGVNCSFDRIVIDVKGSVPTATVRRVTELRQDGSGAKVPLTGPYFLEIKLTPAAAHDDAGNSVYRGPRLVKPNMPKIKGFAMTGDFEGVVTFGAAFKTKPDYRTMKLHSPERFVIDIKH